MSACESKEINRLPSRRELRMACVRRGGEEEREALRSSREERLRQMLERSAGEPAVRRRSDRRKSGCAVRENEKPQFCGTFAAAGEMWDNGSGEEPDRPTEYIYPVSSASAAARQGERLNAKFLNAPRRGNPFFAHALRRSPVLSAILFSSVIAVSLAAVFNSRSAVAMSSVFDDSVLQHVSHGKNASRAGSIPRAIAAVRGAEDEAQTQTLISQSRRGEYKCAPKTGANSIVGAYLDTAANLYYPMPAGSYTLSSPFGYRIHPITGERKLHTGQDMAAPVGTPFYAVADGEVVSAGVMKGSANNAIIVRHSVRGKTFYAWYLHMWNNGILVKPGDRVKAGQKIGLVGSQGRSTGPHLHFEICDGADYNAAAVDPMKFLREAGAADLSQNCG